MFLTQVRKADRAFLSECTSKITASCIDPVSIASRIAANLYISAPRGPALLFYDLHMLFVHTSAVYFELRQSTGDFFHVFRGHYNFGGFDVLLKVLDLARPGIGTMNGFRASSHASDNCAAVAPFLFANSVIRSTYGLFAAMLSGGSGRIQPADPISDQTSSAHQASA
jgi:hypothetical protein